MDAWIERTWTNPMERFYGDARLIQRAFVARRTTASYGFRTYPRAHAVLPTGLVSAF